MRADRKKQSQEIINIFKNKYPDRVPTLTEFVRETEISESLLRRCFGGWGLFLNAMGVGTYQKLETNELAVKQERRYKALCSKKEQIQGFFRHIIDLNEMFERAGNPPSIKMVGLGDVHVKYLDPAAFHCMLQFCEWYNPHAFLIIGDFADCEGISHWDSSTLEPKRLVPELIKARKVLEAIEKSTPNVTTRIFCEGNHENWISQALLKMPELFEGLNELMDIEISVPALLGLEKYGYEFFPVNHLVKIGNLHFTHGIYTTTNHTKKHLDIFKANIEYGHLHDKQEHNQTSVEGSMSSGCMGCLCKLDALFLKGKPNNWVHLINIYEFMPDGSYTKMKPEIIEGRVSIMGKVFIGKKDWYP